MVQVDVRFISNAGELNELLREYPTLYPKRKIISVSCAPNEPMGWFSTIAYILD